MFSVTRTIRFCYGHRLMDYEGKCQHPHGHNGAAEIEIGTSELDRRGMVVDLGEIKDVVQAWIDRELDHRMILRKDDPLVRHLDDLGEPYFLMETNPTAENIARLIFEFVRARDFPVTAVRLWETDSSVAVYRP